MKRFYTAESVTEGHPDKLCDLIADSILDACLKEDENSRVACEVLATKGNIIVQERLPADLSHRCLKSSKRCWRVQAMKQRKSTWMPHPQTESGYRRGSGEIQGTQSRDCFCSERTCQRCRGSGIMIGYACDETPQLMPMPVVLANRIVRELSASRRSGYITGILPDGKAQVTVEYEDDRPVRLDTVVVSCQHEKEKSLRKLEHEIREKVLRPALRMLPPDEDTKILD